MFFDWGKGGTKLKGEGRSLESENECRLPAGHKAGVV